MKRLEVWMGRTVAGALVQANDGRLTFTYDPDYASTPNRTPLSLSMPLTIERHQGRVVLPFLQGLLPDNVEVLGRWGRQFGVSPRNPFGLLAHVGADCAGAIQFLPEGREPDTGQIQWLTDDDVAARLRLLRQNPAAWLGEDAHGHFSLAGAQSKFALLRHGDRWGEPTGAIPTTHILKPAGPFEMQDLNEYLCLRTAAALGVLTARCEYRTFGDEVALVVQRYDRRPADVPEGVRRVHQEDFCQALAVHPDRKYQSQGGPGAAAMVELLRRSVAPSAVEGDIVRVVEALALNWALGATDGHAKNHSLLLSGRQVRLAPFYDIASALPYATAPPGAGRRGRMELGRLALALKVGRHYALWDIDRRDWEILAQTASVDPDVVRSVVTTVLDRVVDAMADVVTAMSAEGVEATERAFASKLLDTVGKHVDLCHSAMRGHAVGSLRHRPER